jgi:hypothetical protein
LIQPIGVRWFADVQDYHLFQVNPEKIVIINQILKNIDSQEGESGAANKKN